MAMATLTSACNTNLSKTLSFEDNHSNLRDASFSAYLNSAEESFVLKLAESSQNLSPITSLEHLYMGRKKAEGGEIGVFGAERYFNGGIEEETPRIITNKCVKKFQCKENEPVDLDQPTKPKNQLGTPSVRSESSGNSQIALLHSVMRNPSRSKSNKVHGKSFLASLGCKCSCADKDSVDIDEYAGGEHDNRTTSCGVVHGKAITNELIKRTGLNPVDAVQICKPRSESWTKEEMHCQKFDKLGVRLNKENCVSSPNPIINSGAGNKPVEMHFQGKVDEKLRKSLEVFGSPTLDKINKSLSLERKLTMLSWDATRGAEEIEIPSASGGIYNDTESDASSDLFEIESLTGKANSFLTGQASDGTSPTTCYAPSEASIEWSVVTASVADFSVMSDYEERRSTTTVTSPRKKFVTTTNSAKATTDTEMTRRRPGILLGCKSHKAVRVAGDAYRSNEKAIFDPRMRIRPESAAPVTRFQTEAKLVGFNSRNGQHAYATRLLPRAESTRSSHLLYIQ